jgi:hypothetical protein
MDRKSLFTKRTPSLSSAAAGTKDECSQQQQQQQQQLEASEENVDVLLSNELKSLSVQDRNNIQEEIHGVHFMTVQETTPFVQSKLQEFDLYIVGRMMGGMTNDNNNDNTMTETTKRGLEAYEKAIRRQQQQQQQTPSSSSSSLYICSESFRLTFLRADLFDMSKACSRYIHHIYLLEKYFGPVALQRPLRYSDLTKNEQDIFKVGSAQVLPSRDRSGRLIAVHYGSMGGDSGPSRVRIIMIEGYSALTIG